MSVRPSSNAAIRMREQREQISDEDRLLEILRFDRETMDRKEQMESLLGRKIKSVTIQCEDGTTYEGNVSRIEGIPFDMIGCTVETIVREPAGSYGIKNVIYANPTTIVEWTDGTKTTVTCMDNMGTVERKENSDKGTPRKKPLASETYSKGTGLALCIAKKHFGNQGNYNNVFRKYGAFEDLGRESHDITGTGGDL